MSVVVTSHIFPRSLDPIWISLTQLLFACIQQHYNLLYFNYSQGLVISKPKEGYFFYYSKIQHFYSIRLMILSGLVKLNERHSQQPSCNQISWSWSFNRSNSKCPNLDSNENWLNGQCVSKTASVRERNNILSWFVVRLGF